MRLLTLLCFLAVCALATPGASQEVKKDGITYDMAYMETVFAIKLRTAKIEPGKTKDEALVTMTLEFTRDSSPDRKSATKLPGYLRDSFAGKEALTPLQRPGHGKLLKCYFFDGENVAFTKQPPGKIEGEVTGKAGDAFRIIQSVPNDVLAKTKRISFREEPVEKK